MRKIIITAAPILLILLLAFVSSCGEKNEEPSETTLTQTTAAPSATAAAVTSESVTEETYLSGEIDVVFNGKYEKKLDFGDHVKLSDYKGVEVEYNGRTREEILNDVLSLGKGVFEERREGTVIEGDVLDLDFKAYRDGSDKPFMSNTNYQWNTGKGEFFDTLGLDLTGETIGSEVKRTLKFPDNYPENELRNTEADFVITINYAADYTDPEVDDAFISKYTGGKYDSVDGYAGALYEKEVINGVKDACFEKVYEAVVQRGVTYDEEVTGALEEDMRNSDTDLADQLKTTPAAYYGLTEEGYEERVKTIAGTYFTKEVIVYAIAYVEKIDPPSDEEISEYINEKASAVWLTPEKYTDIYGIESIKESVFWNKVTSFLARNAKINGADGLFD